MLLYCQFFKMFLKPSHCFVLYYQVSKMCSKPSQYLILYYQVSNMCSKPSRCYKLYYHISVFKTIALLVTLLSGFKNMIETIALVATLSFRNHHTAKLPPPPQRQNCQRELSVNRATTSPSWSLHLWPIDGLKSSTEHASHKPRRSTRTCLNPSPPEREKG